MKYNVEMTDTFSGEANYAWVRRMEIEAPEAASTRALVRRAKQALGVTGPHSIEDVGDVITVTPIASNTVIFITCHI